MTRQTILLVEDDTQLRQALAETLTLADYDVLTAVDGNTALQALAQTPVSAVVTDIQMQPMDGCELLSRIRDERPELPVLLMTAHGSVEHAVEAMMAGASDYITKPFDAQALNEKISRIMPPMPVEGGVVAEDPVTLQLLQMVGKVAVSDTTVLLTGESGVGKEVFARYLHENSDRAAGPFVAINCAAIPENMLEAILFGHEKGAFTGAHASRPGKFEQAQGGTLLLDEISEMALDLQAKLLRVLQEKEVERIGGQGAIPLDIRVLATTNRDLRAYVSDGKFREDLYYRLSVFPLALPPLRERRGDVIPLAELFLNDCCAGKRPAPQISAAARANLLAYDFPGNVRELQNLMQRAVILCGGQMIDEHDLHFEGPFDRARVQAAPDDTVPVADPDKRLQDGVQNAEGQLIIEALRSVGGNRKKAAEDLGISPRTLRYKLARLRDAGYEIPGRA
ncbi:MAG: sigma-54-dependent Fis family transcriptional regulator [Gammaproteobacteria bacterium]|nr:sigma-54 dependent transcriptional regulator [Gammaproteobacteria bacterium]NND54976.1 sigma-54-dependent Fis family transcriptional regulator [Gammaproteobacteria bacterium]